MESYYDKDAGVAWGPITKEEMLDDLLIYVPKTVKNRKTLGCTPTFENKLYRHDSSNKLDIEECKEFMLKENEIVILSSDEENLTESCFSCKDSFNTKGNSHDEGCDSLEIDQLLQNSKISIASIDNIESNNISNNIKDRLPTPANLDEDTYDEICDYNEEKNNSYIHEDNVSLEQIGNASGTYQRGDLDQQNIFENNLPSYSNTMIDHCTYYGDRETQIKNVLNIPEDTNFLEHIETASSGHERNTLAQRGISETTPLATCNIESTYYADSETEIENNLLKSPALRSHSLLEIADIHEDHVLLEQIKNSSRAHESSNSNKQDIFEYIPLASCNKIEHHTDYADSKTEIENNLLKSPEVSSHSKSEIADRLSAHTSDHDEFNDTLAEMERLLNQHEYNDSCKNSCDEDVANKSKSFSAQDSCKIPIEVTQAKTVDLMKEEFDYTSYEDTFYGDIDNLSLKEELCPLSSTSNEVPTSKLKPKIIISDTKPKSTMKSALPVYNRKVVTHKMMPNANARSPLFSVNTQANYQSLKSTPTHSKQQFVHPAPKTASAKKRFQNIESPISIYIKNAGVTPLFKKITPSKPLSCDKVMVNSMRSCSNKENSVLFPEVVYKPAKHAIVTTDKVVKLPNNIDSLIPHKPTVTKHVERIGQSSKEKISKRLLEADLTMNTSLSTNEDMSIHVTKATYIS